MMQEAIKRLWCQALNMAGVNAFLTPADMSLKGWEKHRENIWNNLPRAFAELKMHGNLSGAQKEYLEKLFL